MNTITGTIVAGIAGGIIGKLLVVLFFIKVIYPNFLKKHEDFLAEVFLGDE